MPLKLPPDDDPIWDIVREHGMSVTVFKVVLRMLAEKRGLGVDKAEEEPSGSDPPQD